MVDEEKALSQLYAEFTDEDKKLTEVRREMQRTR
jgi:hypothetical protein